MHGYMSRHTPRNASLIIAVIISLAFFALYLFTLAPTVLWGDDAYFQRVALTGELRPDGGGHWLWLQLAALFVKLPWGDVAYRVNLLSAVAAAATLFILYAAGRQAGLRSEGAVIAVSVLGVGHTFWMHAVRAEVYTIFTIFVAVHFWLWARWVAGPGSDQDARVRAAPLYAGAALFGLTLLAHQMALFLLPCWLLMLWWQRSRLKASQIMQVATVFVAGLLPFLWVMHIQIIIPTGATMIEALRLYFTQAGADFSGAFFAVTTGTLPRALLMILAFTALQFSSPALLLALVGLGQRLRRSGAAFWWALLAFYAIDAIFAATYDVNDRYVFLLPGYLALALFAGAGWQAARQAVMARLHDAGTQTVAQYAVILSLALMLAAPIAVYAITPRLLASTDVDVLPARSLPGREPNMFFLWPGKRGYVGASQYGINTLETLPPNASLIADHTPLQTLKYLQIVGGIRQDVRLIAIEPGDDLGPLIERVPQKDSIFLADSNPDYYNLHSVPQATLADQGPIYHLAIELE